MQANLVMIGPFTEEAKAATGMPCHALNGMQ